MQLWLALPGADRQAAPAFEHHAQLPVLGLGAFEVTVFAGSLADVTSPARTYSRLVGAEIHAVRDGSGTIPLVPGHEHVVFAASGEAVAGGIPVSAGSLLYLGTGRGALALTGRAGARLFLLGGEPLGETLLMWWNFVGRTPDDIVEAARAWSSGERFGEVQGLPRPAPGRPAPRCGAPGPPRLRVLIRRCRGRTAQQKLHNGCSVWMPSPGTPAAARGLMAG